MKEFFTFDKALVNIDNVLKVTDCYCGYDEENKKLFVDGCEHIYTVVPNTMKYEESEGIGESEQIEEKYVITVDMEEHGQEQYNYAELLWDLLKNHVITTDPNTLLSEEQMKKNKKRKRDL